MDERYCEINVGYMKKNVSQKRKMENDVRLVYVTESNCDNTNKSKKFPDVKADNIYCVSFLLEKKVIFHLRYWGIGKYYVPNGRSALKFPRFIFIYWLTSSLLNFWSFLTRAIQLYGNKVELHRAILFEYILQLKGDTENESFCSLLSRSWSLHTDFFFYSMFNIHAIINANYFYKDNIVINHWKDEIN